LDVESVCGDEPVPMAGMSSKEQRNQMLLEDARSRLGLVRDRVQSLGVQAGVTCKLLDETGRPADVIAREAQRCDLVLVDQPQIPSTLGTLSSDQLVAVVKHCPRPLVVVPDHPAPGTDVVIAYDGSLQAARAVQALAQSGLAAGHRVKVLSFAERFVTAARRVDRAVEFLKLHGVVAEAVPVASEEDPAALILDHLKLYQSGLLVMGTFGQNFVREVLFGSVTRRLIEHCPVPVFIDH
jgi:nucleotide-binding universal stress UspA family protein